MGASGLGRYEPVELVVAVVLPPEPLEPWSGPPFCSPRSLAAADTHWLNGLLAAA